MIKEKWKVIKGHSDYKISNHGKVMNKRTNKILKNIETPTGYLYVNLYKNKKSSRFYVHRLVAFYFLTTKEKETVNHIDGVKSNNYFLNLEWMTISENNSHAHKTGLMNKKGENCNFSILKDSDVIEIRTLHKNGMLQKDIALLYKTSKANISLIVNRKNWKHI